MSSLCYDCHCIVIISHQFVLMQPKWCFEMVTILIGREKLWLFYFQMKNVITGSLKINVAGLQSDKDGKSSVVHVSLESFRICQTWILSSIFLHRDMSWIFHTSKTPQKTNLSRWASILYQNRDYISSQTWLWVPSLIGILSLSQKVGIYNYGHQSWSSSSPDNKTGCALTVESKIKN